MTVSSLILWSHFMTFQAKPTFENKLVWYLPDFNPNVIGREGESHPLDQSHHCKRFFFTGPNQFRTWACLYMSHLTITPLGVVVSLPRAGV